MIWVIQGCISTLYLSMSPWGLFTTSYFVHLHGALYLMTDYYVGDWWRAQRPASADALQVSLQFHYRCLLYLDCGTMAIGMITWAGVAPSRMYK